MELTNMAYAQEETFAGTIIDQILHGPDSLGKDAIMSNIKTACKVGE
jgi:hypothetical protein